jgi:cell division control protein 24
VKKTDPSTPFFAELEEGLASIKRVMDKVNETTRREDNRQAVVDLSRRVEDWKSHDISSFGELLLQETFFVIKNDSEREYNVYLFERIILCCKESGSTGKKSSKSNSILKKPQSKKPTNLQLKGRIFVNNVTGAAPVNKNGKLFSIRTKFEPKLMSLSSSLQVNAYWK